LYIQIAEDRGTGDEQLRKRLEEIIWSPQFSIQGSTKPISQNASNTSVVIKQYAD